MAIRLADGLQVDMRVVPAESFGAALVYFTGSKDHNIVLRGLAKDRGLKINEYGVFRVDGEKETFVAGRTEEEVYATLDLPWIPPELREGPPRIRLGRRRQAAQARRAGRSLRRPAHAHHGHRRQGHAGGNGRRGPAAGA